jgi:hypothetical protein
VQRFTYSDAVALDVFVVEGAGDLSSSLVLTANVISNVQDTSNWEPSALTSADRQRKAALQALAGARGVGNPVAGFGE